MLATTGPGQQRQRHVSNISAFSLLLLLSRYLQLSLAFALFYAKFVRTLQGSLLFFMLLRSATSGGAVEPRC